MHHRFDALLRSVEVYAAGLAVWYAVLLWLGIPKLPPAGHVLGAVAFIGLLVGVAWAAWQLDATGRRRVFVRLTAGFLVGAVGTSLVVGGTALTVKQLMKGTFVGKLLIAVVGASVFAGVVVAAVTVLRYGSRQIPVGR